MSYTVAKFDRNSYFSNIDLNLFYKGARAFVCFNFFFIIFFLTNCARLS